MATHNPDKEQANIMNVITKTTLTAVLVTLDLTLGMQAAELPTRDSAVKSQTILLDGSDWRIEADPGNKGREEKWFESARPDAKPTSVPGVVQNVFTDFHGPAWYYREFDVTVHPHENGRYFLRFGAVDWTAEVWVNGQPIGTRENGENPCTLSGLVSDRENRRYHPSSRRTRFLSIAAALPFSRSDTDRSRGRSLASDRSTDAPERPGGRGWRTPRCWQSP